MPVRAWYRAPGLKSRASPAAGLPPRTPKAADAEPEIEGHGVGGIKASEAPAPNEAAEAETEESGWIKSFPSEGEGRMGDEPKHEGHGINRGH